MPITRREFTTVVAAALASRPRLSLARPTGRAWIRAITAGVNLAALEKGAGNFNFAATALCPPGRLDSALGEAAGLARDLAGRTGRRYHGIDASPAPGLDASIGEAVESLSGVPFGDPGTLQACAMITGMLCRRARAVRQSAPRGRRRDGATLTTRGAGITVKREERRWR